MTESDENCTVSENKVRNKTEKMSSRLTLTLFLKPACSFILALLEKVWFRASAKLAGAGAEAEAGAEIGEETACIPYMVNKLLQMKTILLTEAEVDILTGCERADDVGERKNLSNMIPRSCVPKCSKIVK